MVPSAARGLDPSPTRARSKNSRKIQYCCGMHRRMLSQHYNEDTKPKNRERKRKGYSPEPHPGPRKTGRLGAGKACREAGSAPEYGFDGTRNELLSRGMAGRGAASCGSRKPGGQNRGRAGWPRGRAAPASEEAVACLRCRNAGKSVWKKYWSILSTNIDATGRAKMRTVPGGNEQT